MLFPDDKQFDQITRIIIALANEDYDRRINVKNLNNKLATISVLLNMLSGVLKQRFTNHFPENDLIFLNHIIFMIGQDFRIIDYNTENQDLFSSSDLQHLNLLLDNNSLEKIRKVISSRSFDKSLKLNFKLKDNLYITMNSRITRFYKNSPGIYILSAVKTISKKEWSRKKLLKNAKNPRRQFNISKNKKVVDKLYHYLMDNLDRPLDPISKIAEELNTNPTVLIRGFKIIHGNTIANFHREKRLEKARDLVFDTDTKLINIAEECGFRSLAHFSRTFKKHFGVNPSNSR